MTPKEVKKYFKTGYNFHKITKMSDNSMHNWIKWGYVPFVSQKKLEKITEGKLVAEWVDRD
jgi:hypothetical protein